ncbi:hypothetical protein [Deinococcus marmoris]|uniref:Uncharacterized protein n=1 Tax=Deinococcus marmoris TaxID=249408 RepID=A0A1U7P2Z7_9DEIO|nr:hypothetical protein [Deinococcus marmoris]OLV19530.1 hypothetical protein BOO71_0002329 [Deinococcus marmoris]
MVNLDNNLKLNGVWMRFVPDVRLAGGGGGAVVHRLMNGQLVVIETPNREALTLTVSGENLIDPADAYRIWALWADRVNFPVIAQGAGPSGGDVISEHAIILEQPIFKYITDGENAGCEYAFVINILF